MVYRCNRCNHEYPKQFPATGCIAAGTGGRVCCGCTLCTAVNEPGDPSQIGVPTPVEEVSRKIKWREWL